MAKTVLLLLAATFFASTYVQAQSNIYPPLKEKKKRTDRDVYPEFNRSQPSRQHSWGIKREQEYAPQDDKQNPWVPGYLDNTPYQEDNPWNNPVDPYRQPNYSQPEPLQRLPKAPVPKRNPMRQNWMDNLMDFTTPMDVLPMDKMYPNEGDHGY